MAKAYLGDNFSGSEYYVWPRWNVRTTGWKWTASGSGTDEWYLEVTAGGAPVHPDTGVALVDPPMVEENGTDMTQGTVGSLAAGEFDWGDNDSLGFSTLYVRLTVSGDPDLQADGWVKCGGNDTGTATTRVTAWETVKYAQETGITRNATNGDRINLLSGAADHYASAGENIDISLYATTASEAAPMLLMGCDVVAADGGIGRMSGGSGALLWDDNVFDFHLFRDVRIELSTSGYGFQLDRDTSIHHCHLKNTHTSGRPMKVDLGGTLSDSYIEGYSASSTSVCDFTGTHIRNKVVQKGVGDIGAGSWQDCLIVIEGNSASARGGLKGNLNYGNSTVYTGSPNANAKAYQLGDNESVAHCHVEGGGIGFEVTKSSRGARLWGCSYFNCVTPINHGSGTSERSVVEDPDAAATSIFADAAGGDFSIVSEANGIANNLIKAGFSDPNYSIDETYEIYADETGIGLEDTAGGASSFNPYQSRVFG